MKKEPLQQFRGKHGLLTYRTWGQGFPWIALPPWPFSSLAFAGLAQHLPPGQQLIALDVPGVANHLPSGADPVPAIREIAQEFIQQFAPRSFGLLGYSLGGLLIQLILAGGQVRPAKAVLISTWARGTSLRRARQWAMQLFRLAPKPMRYPLLSGWFGYYAWRRGLWRTFASNPLVAELQLELRHANLDQVFQLIQAASRYDVPPSLPQLPYLVAYGEHDSPYVLDDLPQLGAYHESTVVRLPKMVHEHGLLFPEHFAAAWHDWLN